MSDSVQVAKHQAGEFEYVLSLPAVTTTVDPSTTSDPALGGLKEKEGISTVQFGCNLVRADSKSELQRRNRSNSANTYTLIVTPLETDEWTTIKLVEPIAETGDNMATMAVEAPMSAQQASRTRSKGEPSSRTRIESLLGIRDPSKSVAVAHVVEVPADLLEADEPESNDGQSLPGLVPITGDTASEWGNISESIDDQRLPGLVSATTGEMSQDDGKFESNGEQQSHIMKVHASPAPAQCGNPCGHQLGASRQQGSRRTSEVIDSDDEDIVDEIMSLPPAPSPSSRIEDSVEALDKLEDQLEAINEVTHLDRGLSTRAFKPSAASSKPNTATKRNQSATAKPATKTTPSTLRGKPVVRTGSVRHSMAVTPSKATEDTAARQAAATKRLSVVSRPASLAPPRPVVRSTRAPTVSSFELPGEEVARRLKEKRMARLSMSMPASAQTPGMTASHTKPKTAPSSRPHVRSTRAPTVSSFELPGEAISRRKREETETKLKAEQEEERKRREFKARPIRASLAPGGTFPRQTASSRARMSLKATIPAQASAATSTPTLSTATKRHSTMGPTPSSRPSLALSTTASSFSRGRGSVILSPSTTGISRATSTSTGSIRGSARPMSSSTAPGAEELAHQKLTGKEIFRRESTFVSERERERRSREEAAKKAREDAAERSREWARKQKAKKMGMGTAGTCPSLHAR